MKSLILAFFLLIAGKSLFGQIGSLVVQNDLPHFSIKDGLTLHFISPENISYVDISTHALTGDLPLKNVLRVKLNVDSASTKVLDEGSLGLITIVGESFIAQYSLCYEPYAPESFLPVLVNILPEHIRPLDVSGVSLTTVQLKRIALDLSARRSPRAVEMENAFGITAGVNRVYSAGDYIFLDLSYFNRSDLPFHIDELRFSIEDRKISKATNVQSLEITPEFTLNRVEHFAKQYRNVFVFKKFSFPGNKVLNITLSEKQISGRVITLKLSYKRVLEAEPVPAN